MVNSIRHVLVKALVKMMEKVRDKLSIKPSYKLRRSLKSWNKLLVTTLLFVIVFLLMSFVSAQQSVDIDAGHVYYAVLEANHDTIHWAGINVLTDVEGTILPGRSITNMPLSIPIMTSIQLPDNGAKGSDYYFAAMLEDPLNLSKVENISATDLNANNIFNSTHFPHFYPEYLSLADDPFATLCCSSYTIQLGGVNFSSYRTTLDTGTNLYLLKYDNGNTGTPLFLVEYDDMTCFNSSSCVGQFMIPPANSDYYFYGISKFPEFNYSVFIDGVSTTTFAQTALIYNLTIFVYNAYSGNPAPNLTIIVGEEDGRNIFLPFNLSGYVSNAYSTANTTADGSQQFIVAPTQYGESSTYGLYYGIINGSAVQSKRYLDITSYDGTVQQSKSLSSNELSDNSKVVVNKLNQMLSSLFAWADSSDVYEHTITHELSTSTTTMDGDPEDYFKTGIPNTVTVEVLDGGFAQAGYSVRVKENFGFLVLNPFTGNDAVPEKNRTHVNILPIDTEFTITPTSLYPLTSNVTFEIIRDSDGMVMDTYLAEIDNTLDLDPDGKNSPNENLETYVNDLSIIVSSLFYSLNY